MTLLNGWSERKNRSDERTRTIEGSSVFHSDDKVKDWCACSPTAARLDGEISDEKGILAMLRAQIARRTPLLEMAARFAHVDDVVSPRSTVRANAPRSREQGSRRELVRRRIATCATTRDGAHRSPESTRARVALRSSR
jgi:hypothetical protein